MNHLLNNHIASSELYLIFREFYIILWRTLAIFKIISRNFIETFTKPFKRFSQNFKENFT